MSDCAFMPLCRLEAIQRTCGFWLLSSDFLFPIPSSGHFLLFLLSIVPTFYCSYFLLFLLSIVPVNMMDTFCSPPLRGLSKTTKRQVRQRQSRFFDAYDGMNFSGAMIAVRELAMAKFRPSYILHWSTLDILKMSTFFRT